LGWRDGRIRRASPTAPGAGNTLCFAGTVAYLLNLALETPLIDRRLLLSTDIGGCTTFIVAHRSAVSHFDSPARSCDLDVLIGRLCRGFALCFGLDAKFGGT